MENLLNKESVNRVQEFIEKFDNKLLTIAPTGQFSELAASWAVLAVVSKTKISSLGSNFFINSCTLFTDSLFNKFSIF